MTTLDGFLEQISKRRSSDSVFNPYAESTAETGKVSSSNGDHLRQARTSQMANLSLYLHDLARQPGTDLMLIGEAPGYHGCAQSGIPFTGMRQITDQPTAQLRRIAPGLCMSSASSPSERSADAIWSVIQERQCNVLIWNAFPFHPHELNRPDSNRKPRAAELIEGREYLDSLISLFQPACVVSVGRVAERALSSVLPESAYETVRHPSFGGKTEFTCKMERILDSRGFSRLAVNA